MFSLPEDKFFLSFASVAIAIAAIILTCVWKKKTTAHQEDDSYPKKIPKIGKQQLLNAKRKPLQLVKELGEKLPAEVKQLEKSYESKQLEAIYKLMQEHSDQFGGTTMDDMKNQMQLYGF